ncbi:hypothetical protein ACTQ6A_08905 [Lachnospiraceae bacterium LCP25S3_G4]
MSNLIQNNPEKFDKVVFYICLIDMFFLPYVWFISILYTMPIVYYWSIRRNKYLIKNKEYKLFLIMLLTMGISTLYSYILAPQYAYKNTTYMIQFTSMLLYYFLFTYYIDKYSFQLKNILLFFILFVVVLAVFYNIDKHLYNQLVLLWNNRSGVSINEITYVNFIGYRFSFIWMDANNIAYMMDAIVLYLWCNEKITFTTKLFTLISLLFVLISCMSNGGFLAFFIGASLYLIVELIDLVKKKFPVKIKITVAKLLLLYITVIVVGYTISKIPSYLETSVALEAFQRLQNNNGDSRIRIWNYVLEHVTLWKYVLFGRGGVTLIDNLKYSPHNGHLFFILDYGFLFYTCFMYLFFRKRKITSIKKYIWIIPLFIGFTINVMVGEIKLMGIMMILIACSSSEKYLKIKNRTNE